MVCNNPSSHSGRIIPLLGCLQGTFSLKCGKCALTAPCDKRSPLWFLKHGPCNPQQFLAASGEKRGKVGSFHSSKEQGHVPCTTAIVGFLSELKNSNANGPPMVTLSEPIGHLPVPKVTSGVKGLNGPPASGTPAKRGHPKPNGPYPRWWRGLSRPKAQAAPLAHMLDF